MPHRATLRPRIGLILHRGRDTLFDGVLQCMAEHGYRDGETMTLLPRFAEGDLSLAPDLAQDLVHHEVDLIMAIGAVGARAAQRATSTIPIVFAIVLDPVETGFVASLERPGGNLTGATNFNPDLTFAQLSLLRAVLPGVSRVAVLGDADVSRTLGFSTLERTCESAAGRLGVTLDWVRMAGPLPDRAAAFRGLIDRGCEAVLVLEVPVNIAAFDAIATLANRHGLPAIFPGGWQHGGLLSYGTSLLDTVPALPPLVRLILAGASPGEVPVRQVRQHRLRVNLAAARQARLRLPPEVVARADEVVDDVSL